VERRAPRPAPAFDASRARQPRPRGGAVRRRRDAPARAAATARRQVFPGGVAKQAPLGADPGARGPLTRPSSERMEPDV